MRTLRVGHVTVAWTTNFGDDRVWRCIRTPSGAIELSISYIGSPTSISVGVTRALPVARTLALVRRISGHSRRTR